MKCADAKSLFSPYLDGAVTGTEMRALREHVQSCAACNHQYELLLQTQRALAALGRKKAPADLSLKLRVAISQEAARPVRLLSFLVRLENAINSFMVPATAGLVAAVAAFGVLMGFFALPNLEARNRNDVPLMLYTAPELQVSAFGSTMGSVNSDTLVIEAFVGADGSIQDYRILSDPDESRDLLPQVKRMLIMTRFRPATSLGRPVPGRAVLSFSKISVRG
jgi:hypothetical protein